MKTQLIPGELYQVAGYKKGTWVLATFDRVIEAHTVRGCNINADFSIGKEFTRKEPAAYRFRLAHNLISSGFSVPVNNCDIRPVTQETRDELARLKAQAAEREQAAMAARKELRDFCL